MKKSLKSSKKKNKQKVVFIDWNGTLSPTKFWSQLERSKKQEDRDLFKLWADATFINHKDKIVPWMKGDYTSEYILGLVAKETNTDFDTLLKEFIVGCQLMEYSSPSIPKLIHELRNKNVLVSIASNNMDCFTRWTVPHMGLHSIFDDILNSYDLKAMKHDIDDDGKRKFFHSFFVRHEIDPRNCIFIDDGEDKLNTISDLGIDYRRINATNTLENELQSILAYV